jgi:hypothetical protein
VFAEAALVSAFKKAGSCEPAFLNFKKESSGMWKIVLGFVAFAALAMFVIIKGGDNVDMSGESHSIESHEEKPAVAAPAPAVEPAPAQVQPAK